MTLGVVKEGSGENGNRNDQGFLWPGAAGVLTCSLVSSGYSPGACCHFVTVKETAAQRGLDTYLISHSKFVANTGFKPRSF